MEWYQYLAGFFSGAFLANAVPHFISGVMGNKFPTPFAKPPGKGLSSAPTNVLWALLNVIIGCTLFRFSLFHHSQTTELLIFFSGAGVMSVLSSITFQDKHKE